MTNKYKFWKNKISKKSLNYPYLTNKKANEINSKFWRNRFFFFMLMPFHSDPQLRGRFWDRLGCTHSEENIGAKVTSVGESRRQYRKSFVTFSGSWTLLMRTLDLSPEKCTHPIYTIFFIQFVGEENFPLLPF